MLVHGVPEDPSLSLFQGFRKQSSSPQSQAKGRDGVSGSVALPKSQVQSFDVMRKSFISGS